LVSLCAVEVDKIGDAMHTVWVRLNAVVFFGLTVIVSLASLTWVSTIGHSGFPTVDVLRVNSVKTLRSHVRLGSG
jgi:signal peptidase complex subunit 3